MSPSPSTVDALIGEGLLSRGQIFVTEEQLSSTREYTFVRHDSLGLTAYGGVTREGIDLL